MGRWRTQVYSRAPRDDRDPVSFPREDVNGKKAAVVPPVAPPATGPPAAAPPMALLDQHPDTHKDPNQNGKSQDTRWWNGGPEPNGTDPHLTQVRPGFVFQKVSCRKLADNISKPI